jgi:hypothetical protein
MHVNRARWAAAWLLALTACGDDASPSGSGEDADAAPQSVNDAAAAPPSEAGTLADAGVPDASSPGDGGTPVQAAKSTLFPVGFALYSPTASARRSRNKGIDPAAAATRDERQGQLARLLAGTRLGDCSVLLGSLLMGSGDNVSCYGPQLDYQDHPDAVGGPANGQLPGGDLGLWKETEPDGQACAAAKFNALLDKVSKRVDFGLYLAASALCAARVEGRLGANDAFDGTLDLATPLGEALRENANLTLKRASLARVDAASARRGTHYQLELSFDGPLARKVNVEILHEADVSSAATYGGRLWGTVSEAGRTEAFSVGYDRDELRGTLRYQAVSAAFAAAPVDAFDARGRFQVDSNWSGDIAQGLFELDLATLSTGNASYAWQAGSGDSHARVFNVSAQRAGGVLSSCGFFGYGPKFDRTASALPDNGIDTFICNWAGPMNNHSGRTDHAQKQCMSPDERGVFIPTSSLISYSPVNACSSAAGFGRKLTSETSYDTSALTNNLVDLTTDADYARYVAPVALP